MAKMILATERLILKELCLKDAKFMLQLLNTPTWLLFIGDKNVHTITDAEKYLLSGPIKSYSENEFGLWLVLLAVGNVPIGVCGLIKRDYLEEVDIGFALMSAYEGMGYGFEMAEATVNYALNVLKLNSLVAITDKNNKSCILGNFFIMRY